MPQLAASLRTFIFPAATGQEDTMTDKFIRIALNDRVTRVAHWTVFTVGALSLVFSVAATAASAF